jgi:hypothetical protein
MNVSNDEHTQFLLACLESQRNEDVLLSKELELLMGCSDMKDEAPRHEPVNLSVPDPKSQRDIDNMDPNDAKRFNDSTLAEVNGMKRKGVMELRTLDSLPEQIKIYQSIVNWTSKTNLGVYVRLNVGFALADIGTTKAHRIRLHRLSTFALCSS